LAAAATDRGKRVHGQPGPDLAQSRTQLPFRDHLGAGSARSFGSVFFSRRPPANGAEQQGWVGGPACHCHVSIRHGPTGPSRQQQTAFCRPPSTLLLLAGLLLFALSGTVILHFLLLWDIPTIHRLLLTLIARSRTSHGHSSALLFGRCSSFSSGRVLCAPFIGRLLQPSSCGRCHHLP
jgi:hypothetical protein